MVAVMVAVLGAGCVADDPTSAGDVDALADGSGAPSGGSGAGSDLPVLNVSATGCREGGGHSVHPKFLNPLPTPWTPADIIGDVGEQFTYSEIPDPMNPVPAEGNTMGNYHATMMCEGWVVNGEARTGIHVGFVGMKVEKPTFSDDAPTHHYLVTVVATDDADIHAALMAGGIHATASTASWETMADDAFRIRMATDHNGEYDSIFRKKALGDMGASHVRLWFQHANDDGGFTPVALDLMSEGGTHWGAEGQGYFSHMGTHHHDPLPGAAGKTAALLYEDFDRTITWGPRPVVTMREAYEH